MCIANFQLKYTTVGVRACSFFLILLWCVCVCALHICIFSLGENCRQSKMEYSKNAFLVDDVGIVYILYYRKIACMWNKHFIALEHECCDIISISPFSISLACRCLVKSFNSVAMGQTEKRIEHKIKLYSPTKVDTDEVFMWIWL